ncbi:MAG: succinyl-CoA synthetase subunit alpha [Smithella sp. PtaU1.Bin162]|nr:MAG: succinyl-CoA synthetase subunit alpha [Smithella sp. PtaU1.Bin162]
MDIIEQATMKGRGNLTEAEAKQILKKYDIPVVEEKVVMTIAEAETAAEIMGYPLVLKGLGARLTHKTERGLVKLNLKSGKDVKNAALYIKDTAGNDLEGFLLQPMLEGRKEFVAGLFYDDLFGPVVMFGLGGIFTEALEDVVFRIAPLDEKEAGRMIDDLHAQKLLGAFRGERAPDRQSLIKTLVGLSKISSEIKEIREIDINPLLVAPDGQVTAVDALIVLGKTQEQQSERIPVKPEIFSKLFYPKSIAFIGISAEFGKWGHILFTNVISGNYQGDIYLVNPKGGEIAGRKVYKSVTEIPGRVDLVVVTVPADKVLALIPELKQKNVTNMLLITSGFSEIGPVGRALEDELVAEARKAGIFIMGPNTMGMCNPHISLYCTAAHAHPQPGGTALIAQSGTFGTQLLAFAEKEGIGMRAFGGSGNEAMISIEDYMDGFEIDDVSKTVVLYVESVKNGRRFFESAKRVGRKKPVIILKGGRTKAGAHAAASHTGAMASNIKVFDAACRQAGVVLAEQPMELLDLSAVFSSLPLPRGNRMGIMTLGGGWGVVTADLCMENGLQVPHLSDTLIKQLNKILPPFWSHTNPVDIVGGNNPDVHKKIVEELLKWNECDAVIHMGILGMQVLHKKMLESAVAVDKNYSRKYLEDVLLLLEKQENEFLENTVKLMEIYEKPVVGVYILYDDTSRTIIDIGNSKYKGVAFIAPEKAVKTMAKMHFYAQWLNN